LLLLAGGACWAQSESSPSLGEIARSKAHKKAVKVFTEDDIPSRPAAADSSASPTAAKQGPATSATNEKPASNDGAKSTGAGGAALASDLKAALVTAREQQEAWKKSAQHYQELLATETNDFRRQMYQDALENDRKNAALFQKKADQLQEQLAAAEKSSK
jgi:hypothetical protein